MSSEIINIGIGQAGIDITHKLWTKIIEEHGLNKQGNYEGENDMQLMKINRFFKAIPNKYIPRTFLIDTDYIDYAKLSSYEQLYDPDSFLGAGFGSSATYARARYSHGTELIDQLMDRLDKHIEHCDQFMGINAIYDLGSGTGSGLSTTLLDKFNEKYWRAEFQTADCIIPSEISLNNPLEVYNAVLGLMNLIEHSTIVNIYDKNFLSGSRNSPKPKTLDNNDVSYYIFNLTHLMRFPHYNNTDYRKIGVNLIPFQRMHFLTPKLINMTIYNKDNLLESLTACFKQDIYQTSYNRQNNNVFASLIATKGTSLCYLDSCLRNLKLKHNQTFAHWLPNSYITTSSKYVDNNNSSLIGLHNTSAIVKPLQNLLDNFIALFSKKAFIHSYISDGMELQDFTEARDNLRDLISEYINYEETGIVHTDEDDLSGDDNHEVYFKGEF
jgi:tubulin beta